MPKSYEHDSKTSNEEVLIAKLVDKAHKVKELEEKKKVQDNNQKDNTKKKLHQSPLEAYLDPDNVKPAIHIESLSQECVQTLIQQIIYNNNSYTAIKLLLENAQKQELVQDLLIYIDHLLHLSP